MKHRSSSWARSLRRPHRLRAGPRRRHRRQAHQAGATNASAESKQLNKLADEYYDALARFDPVSAGESGDNRFIDQIGMSIAPKNRASTSSRCTRAT
jgi:hypothetical protein